MDDATRAWLNWSNLPTRTRLILSRESLAERFAIVGRVMPGGLTTPAQFIRACESIVPYYVIPSEYNGAATIPTFTVEDLHRIATRPAWRRVAYGPQLKGDSIGFHLFDEFYRVAERLVSTKVAGSVHSRADDATPENNYSSSGAVFPEGIPPCQDMKDVAEAGWAGSAFTAEDAGLPRSQATIGMSAPTSEAGLERRFAYLQADAPNLIARSIDVYVFAGITDGDPDEGCAITFAAEQTCYQFKAGGENVLHRKWSKLGGVGPSKIATPRIRFGANVIPAADWPDCPVVPDPSTNGLEKSVTVGGYAVLDKLGIAKWNVAGGLRYVNTQA